MIIVVKRSNIALIVLILLLCISIYSLNVKGEDTMPVTGESDAQKTVIVDAGHGGEDPGAVSDYSGIKEKDINLEIAYKLKDLLEKGGYKVILTRSEDILKYPPGTTSIYEKRKADLTTRKKIMDESGADIVVSIHLNKFDKPQYFGAQTFFPPNSPESQRLAMCIQQSLRENLDPNNTREALVKKESIVILRDLKTVTSIVECGFLSNPEEEKKLATPEYRDKLADAIFIGINKYFGK